MALSDALSDAERNIADFRDERYSELFDRIDEILCKMIALRLELNSFRCLDDNRFYEAVSAGDYEKYRQLDTEFDRTFNAARMGLKDASMLQRLKFFIKLK